MSVMGRTSSVLMGMVDLKQVFRLVMLSRQGDSARARAFGEVSGDEGWILGSEQAEDIGLDHGCIVARNPRVE
jgi:hypothetical protein